MAPTEAARGASAARQATKASRVTWREEVALLDSKLNEVGRVVIIDLGHAKRAPAQRATEPVGL